MNRLIEVRGTIADSKIDVDESCFIRGKVVASILLAVDKIIAAKIRVLKQE